MKNLFPMMIDRLQERTVVEPIKKIAPKVASDIVEPYMPNMFSPPMTMQSAQRMGAFWSVAGAMRR